MEENHDNVWILYVGFGVLLFIAILVCLPRFLHINAKVPQSEAKTNLSSIATAEISYFAELRAWSGSFEQIGWSREGKTKYVYFITPTEHLGRDPYELGLTFPIDFAAYGSPEPGFSADGFTAVAIGNIDSDSTLDVWWIDKNKDPRNTKNDVNE